MELAIIVARLLQYLGAAVLFGSSLFFIYALPPTGPGAAAEARWARPLLAGAAALLALSSLLGLGAQASLLAGSWTEGLTGGAIGTLVSYLDLGKAAVVRASAATVALVLVVVVPPHRTNWLLAAAFGAIATASLGWMGHAAAEGQGGAYHIAADVIHALTAAVWVGALVAFVFLLARTPSLTVIHAALRRFSRIGLPLVLVLALTGLANGWFLVGPDNAITLAATPYGRLLLVKLTLFAAMLVLAAINRNRLTPAIESDLRSGVPNPVHLAQLRRSIAFESGLAACVLAAVAWFGILEPPVGG